MDAALWSQGQPIAAPVGGWDGTYWAKGQPQPGVVSAVNTVAGAAQLGAAATITAGGVVVRHSPVTLTVTTNITRAVGERVAPSVLIISTPNATITATPRGNARGRTAGGGNWMGTASVLFRGHTLKAGVLPLSATGTIQATPRTNSQTSASLLTAATVEATPRFITHTSTALSVSAILTGSKGHRITGSATQTLAGAATINATPAAATGVKITHQVRALLKATQSRTQTTAARLYILHTSTSSSDALLKGTYSPTQSVAALLKATQSRDQTTDALLYAERELATTTTALLWAEQSRTQTANAVLKATFTRTATTGALLKGVYPKTFTTTALLKKTQSPFHRTRALLRATRARTTTTDALLWAERSLDLSTDALLWKEQSLDHSTAASMMPERAEQHHTTARLYGRVSLTHGTNARLLMEFTGSGTLNLPSLQLTGVGLLNHYFPTKAEISFAKLQMKGKGSFVAPEAKAEVPTDVYYRNRRYLEGVYGWGRRDLSEPFSYNPCRCVQDEVLGISALAVDPAYLEWDRQRALRAALLAQERRQARLADPNYQEPVWGLPEPAEAQEEVVPAAPGRHYTVEPRRGPLPPVSGGVKTMPTITVEVIEIEPVRPPQPVVVRYEPEPVVFAEPEPPRVSFHVEPPRPKIQHEPGEILVRASLPAPVPPEPPVFVPPQPISREMVEVDSPVAVLEPPSMKGRGFSVGPRNRKRKH